MKINISTEVDGHFRDVFERFDRTLFEHLKPKGAKMEVVEFTGSKKGDAVKLKFISPLKAMWESAITDDGSSENEAYFVDEGVVLPWPLKRWKHRHIVRELSSNRSIIVDDIEYSTGFWLMDLIIWPVMYITFVQRKPQYKAFFKDK
jgi:ligand-binding SRPBCC domain-containing protein